MRLFDLQCVSVSAVPTHDCSLLWACVRTVSQAPCRSPVMTAFSSCPQTVAKTVPCQPQELHQTRDVPAMRMSAAVVVVLTASAPTAAPNILT